MRAMPLVAWFPIACSTILTLVAVARLRVPLLAASFAVFLDNALSLDLAANDWAVHGLLSWTCALIALLSLRWMNVAIAALFALTLLSDLGYGLVQIGCKSHMTYADTLLEYHRTMTYWWAGVALASCQCALLLGWAGYDLGGGKRDRSGYRSCAYRLRPG